MTAVPMPIKNSSVSVREVKQKPALLQLADYRPPKVVDDHGYLLKLRRPGSLDSQGRAGAV